MDSYAEARQNRIGRRNFEMINASKLKAKRAAAGIAGNILCKKLGIARSRLSDIERGYVNSTEEELVRVNVALEELIRAKSVLSQTAAALGWPVSRVVP
jgi:transcriptional regulator with XRE-family HTH domain